MEEIVNLSPSIIEGGDDFLSEFGSGFLIRDVECQHFFKVADILCLLKFGHP
jgi:hypothetical protein